MEMDEGEWCGHVVLVALLSRVRTVHGLEQIKALQC